MDYINRLEQGRDRNPSLEVLAALSDALRLDQAERAWLRRLAAVGQSSRLCPTSPPNTPIQSTTLALIERLDPVPAVLIERTMDLSAWNSSYDRLMRPMGLFDGERANLLRHLFLEPNARNYFVDWETVAGDLVGQLHAGAIACFVDRR